MKRMVLITLASLLVGLAACDGRAPDAPGAGQPATPPGGAEPGATDPGDDQTPPAGVADLAVRNVLLYPTRIAAAPDGTFRVTDAKVGAVFVLDANLEVIGEIADAARPLGVAVGADGRTYVGAAARHVIDVYDAAGRHVATLGEGAVQMPNDLALDAAGNLYVADSQADEVKVFGADGAFVRAIGAGRLLFPAAVAVAERGGRTEVFVADQGNYLVQVFASDGTWLRSFGGAVEAFSNVWQGRFVKLQGLAVDAQGVLHAVDSYLNNVQLLDATTGAFLGSRWTDAAGTGQLRLPLGVALTADGDVLVANAEAQRVEIERNPAARAGEGD